MSVPAIPSPSLSSQLARAAALSGADPEVQDQLLRFAGLAAELEEALQGLELIIAAARIRVAELGRELAGPR